MEQKKEAITEPAFFYEVADWNKGKVIIKDKNFNSIGITNLKKLDTEGKIGVVCSMLASGNTLKQICTGEDWRPTLNFFLSKCKSNSKYEAMFKKAEDIRISVLTEELIDLRNSPDEDTDKKINNLTKIISVFKNTNPVSPVLNATLWSRKGEKREDFIYGFICVHKLKIKQ